MYTMKIRLMLFFLLILSLLVFGGCAKMDTAGVQKETETVINIEIANNTNTTINLNPTSDLDTGSGDLTQNPDGDADLDTKVPLSVPFLGGTSSSSIGGDSRQEGVESKYKKEESQTINGPQGPATVTPTPVVTPSTKEEGEENDEVSGTESPNGENQGGGAGTYNSVESHQLKGAGNGRNFNWLAHNGGYYGKNIKIEFDTGESFLVRNGAISTDQNGGKNMGLMWWFSGNDYKPGTGEHNPSQYEPGKGRASAFSAVGSKARSMQIYYNR